MIYTLHAHILSNAIRDDLNFAPTHTLTNVKSGLFILCTHTHIFTNAILRDYLDFDLILTLTNATSDDLYVTHTHSQMQ